MRGVALIILFTFSLNACQNKNKLPHHVLPKEKMQAVLWDIIQADNFTHSFITRDSSRKPLEENAKLQLQVFAIHQVTKEDFYTSFEFYRDHTELMGAIMDSMIAKKGKERKKLTESKTGFPLN